MYPVVIEIYRMKLISFSLVGSCTVVGKLVMVKAYSFNRVPIIILQNSHKLKTQPNFQRHPTGFWNIRILLRFSLQVLLILCGINALNKMTEKI